MKAFKVTANIKYECALKEFYYMEGSLAMEEAIRILDSIECEIGCYKYIDSVTVSQIEVSGIVGKLPPETRYFKSDFENEEHW